MSLLWLKNGSGWAKVFLVILGFAAGYCFRVELNAQRITSLEEWKIEHNGAVTGPQEQRLRLAESSIAATIKTQEFVADTFVDLRGEIRDLRREVADIRIMVSSRSGGRP